MAFLRTIVPLLFALGFIVLAVKFLRDPYFFERRTPKLRNAFLALLAPR